MHEAPLKAVTEQTTSIHCLTLGVQNAMIALDFRKFCVARFRSLANDRTRLTSNIQAVVGSSQQQAGGFKFQADLLQWSL